MNTQHAVAGREKSNRSAINLLPRAEKLLGLGLSRLSLRNKGASWRLTRFVWQNPANQGNFPRWIPPRQPPPTNDPALIAAIRAETDNLRARLDSLKDPNPWLVVFAGLLTGILLAAAVITAAYLTPPFPH